MKNFILFTILAVTMILLQPVNNCEAKDVWVAHWKSENVDIYVMDDTIIHGSSNDSKYFKVLTKRVQNGKLINVIDWHFIKSGTSMWRYETNTMDGMHDTVVIPKSAVFEFCMNKIGWSYQIVDDMWYY